MVKYSRRHYPAGIPLNMEEVAGHMDIESVNPAMDYSLHTEYSYGMRRLDSDVLKDFLELVNANKRRIPMLWYNEEWAKEFAGFVKKITEGAGKPSVIEIHPGFNNYCSIERFAELFPIFADEFPESEIFIENRCGSLYYGGKFFLSKVEDFLNLADVIEKKQLRLKFAFDAPQLYTMHFVDNDKSEMYCSLLNEVKPIRELIGGVHLWGKRANEKGRRVAHCGDLNSYFDGEQRIKNEFLKAFVELFDDGIARPMVLEVNSSDADLQSICEDLISVGTKFV